MIELIYPPNRLEALLASAAGEESWEPDYATLEAPRIELYLRKILGEDVELPERPITRVEAFLAYKCGEDVELPTPITRIEMFLAKDTPVEPAEMPEPQTRIEYYLLNLQGGGGTLMTYTGNLPTTITALAKAIHSLTQYGLCTQADTPTPSAPVDIKCNNGALKMVDDELPTGYKRVLGFTCDNNSMWEITGFHLKGSDTVRISFSVNAACNVFGCYQSTDATDNYDLYASVSSGSKYFRYGSGTYLSYFAPADLGERFDVIYTPNGSTGMPQDSTWSPLTFTSENDLLIGATTLTGTSAKMKGNLYGNFEVDGRLKLIPCERVSDNVLGYYDTYSETFYEPYSGYDGAVSLGYDGSHYSLAAVGNPEVLSVTASGATTQTASVENLYSVDTYKDEQDIISGTVNRAVGVAVMTGEETVSTSNACYTIGISDRLQSKVAISCSHFPYSSKSSSQTDDQTIISFSSTNIGFRYDALHQTRTTVIAEQSVTLTEGSTALSSSEIAAIQSLNDGDSVVVTIDGVAYPTTVTKFTRFGTTMWRIGAGDPEGVMVAFVADSTNEGSVSGTPGTYTIKLEAVTASAINATQFKSWLKEQYALGTPVIVIYPLAEEVTESVTGQHLATAEGTNTVSVTSNVDPVKLTVVYKGTEEVTEP